MPSDFDKNYLIVALVSFGLFYNVKYNQICSWIANMCIVCKLTTMEWSNSDAG